METKPINLAGKINIIFAIAAKDIIDAVKSKLIVALIGTMCLILLMPRLLAWAIEPPYTALTIFSLGNTRLLSELESNSAYRVQKANSIEELASALSNTIEPTLGLVIPADFDAHLQNAGTAKLYGYTTWTDRFRADSLKTDLEKRLSETIKHPVEIEVAGNLLYPPEGSGLTQGLLTINAVTVILLMGVMLVPSLIFEEKQTKSIEALLVSPAGIEQVVGGKALAGLFYILACAGVVFTLNWSAVVHWELCFLFTLASGSISVALGLALGSFFERQADVIGLTMALIGILIGALLVKMLAVELPVALSGLLPWIPSVPLAEIFSFAFLETFSWTQVWRNMAAVLLVSAPFDILAAWKLRRYE